MIVCRVIALVCSIRQQLGNAKGVCCSGDEFNEEGLRVVCASHVHLCNPRRNHEKTSTLFDTHTHTSFHTCVLCVLLYLGFVITSHMRIAHKCRVERTESFARNIDDNRKALKEGRDYILVYGCCGWDEPHLRARASIS